MFTKLLLRSMLLTLVVAFLAACGGVLEVGVEPTQTPGTEETPDAVATPTTEVAETDPAASPTLAITATETVTSPTTEIAPTQTSEATATTPPEATPQPGPAQLRVAYVKDRNAFVWSVQAGERPLTSNGGVTDVLLSDDGQRVAFKRDGQLWVVNSDGTDERQLTNDDHFANIPFGEMSDVVVDVWVYQIGWLPGTHTLLFNTAPLLTGPGLVLTNDLWRVDADAGQVEPMLQRGEGGNFVLSPDGTQLALVTPERIHLMNIDGSNVREVLTYEPVITYSEYQYYVTPVWAPDSSSLRVAVPPADPLAEPRQPATLWHVYTDGTPAQQLGQIATNGIFHMGNIAISPDLSQVAFLQESSAGGNTFPLMLAPLSDTVGQPESYATGVNEIKGWSPDSSYFVYSDASEGLLLGQAGIAPRNIGSTNSAVFGPKWADEQQFVYLQQEGTGWNLMLGTIEGNSGAVTYIEGTPPSYDVDN